MAGEIIDQALHPYLASTDDETLAIIKAGFRNELGTSNLHNSFLINGANQVLEANEEGLLKVSRWSDFGLPGGLDFNTATHSYRQAVINLRALALDASVVRFSGIEQEVIVAAALLHDLGEKPQEVSENAVDVSDVEKEKDRKLHDLNEAARCYELLAQSFLPHELMYALWETYIRVATSLSADDFAQLPPTNPDDSYLSSVSDWPKLRRFHRIYEKYGYAITGVQQLDILTTDNQLSSEERDLLSGLDDSGYRQAWRDGVVMREELRRELLFGFTMKRDLPPLELGIPSSVQLYQEIIHIINKRAMGIHLPYSEGFNGNPVVCDKDCRR